MGIFTADIVPEMTQETKDRVRREEIERAFSLVAKEIRILKGKVKALEDRK